MTNDRRVTGLRRGLSEIENDLIDELTSGRIDRREFLRHGSVLGLGMPLLSTLAGALGVSGLGAAAFAPAARAAKPGGTIRAATLVIVTGCNSAVVMRPAVLSGSWKTPSCSSTVARSSSRT